MTGSAVPVGSSGLLERAVEITTVRELVAKAGPGSGQVVVVVGPPGIGKTSLMDAIRESAAERGLPILSARGTELARDVSFGSVGELFAGVSSWPKVLGRAGLTGAGVAPRSARTGDFAVLQELYDLTTGVVADGGLVVMVDDCHWLDTPSLRFLAYLTARISGSGVLLCLASRPDAGPGRQPMMDEVRSGSGVVTLQPQLLSRGASDQLLTGLLADRPDPAFAAVCFRETAGNPLLLSELASAVTDASVTPVAGNAALVGRIGAHAVKHRVLGQLSMLSSDENLVLNAVAVLGDGARQAELSTIAGPSVDIPGAVVALARAGLLRGDPSSGVEFIHPLIRASVYETIDPAVRAQTHQRAAEMLSESQVGVETVAAHYVAQPEPVDERRTGGEQSPEELLLRAANQALLRGSPESALRYLRRALAVVGDGPLRQDMLLAAGRAAFQVDLPSAVDYLDQSIGTIDDEESRVALAGTLVAALLLTGRVGEALDVVRREQALLAAVTTADDATHADLSAYLDTLLAMVAANNIVSTDLNEHVRSLLRRPSAPGFGGRSLDGVLSLYQAARAEPDAIDRASRAIADGVWITGEAGRPPVPISVSVLLAADRDEALAHLDRAVERIRDEGSLLAASGAYAYRAHARLLRGDLAGAYGDARTARWSTSILGLRNRSFIAAVLANTCMELGKVDEAEEAFTWSEIAAAPPDRPFTYFALCALGAFRRASGDAAGGWALTQEAGARFTASGGINPAQVPWRSEAALCAYGLGDVDSASELARQELEFARKWGAPRALGRSLRVLAVVEARPPLLDEAVALLRPSIARLELTECLLARAATGGATAASDLAEGAELAKTLGAIRLAAAAAELRTAAASA